MAKKKQNVAHLQLRSAADFYIVPLENDDYTLTDEALKKCVDPRTLKAHGWFYPTLKFISFKEGKLELLNTSKTSFGSSFSEDDFVGKAITASSSPTVIFSTTLKNVNAYKKT